MLDDIDSEYEYDPEPDSDGDQKRETFRLIGPMVLGVGLLFAIPGLRSVVDAVSTGEMPKLFWCAFVGVPLVMLGVSLCRFAFGKHDPQDG